VYFGVVVVVVVVRLSDLVLGVLVDVLRSVIVGGEGIDEGWRGLRSDGWVGLDLGLLGHVDVIAFRRASNHCAREKPGLSKEAGPFIAPQAGPRYNYRMSSRTLIVVIGRLPLSPHAHTQKSMV
jgi:hypothetical protein